MSHHIRWPAREISTYVRGKVIESSELARTSSTAILMYTDQHDMISIKACMHLLKHKIITNQIRHA